MPERPQDPREEVSWSPLRQIALDLWGEPAAAPLAEPVAPPQAPAAPPPDWERLWAAADETVDWTVALGRETPPEGMARPELWPLYRQHAPAVLRGDVQAYMAVLRAADPLRDLKPFARAFTVRAADADTLHCLFQVDGERLQAAGPQGRRYVAGVALRAARDLLALLPVRHVALEARAGERLLLQADYAREGLRGLRPGFTDPVALVDKLGGRWG